MYTSNQDVPIEQAIIRNPLTLPPDATVAEAIALMNMGNHTCNLTCEIDSEINLQIAHAQCSCILVTDGKKLIGILTERDLIKLCGQKTPPKPPQNLIEITIAEVMTYPVYSLLEWEFTDILVPTSRFHRFGIRHLPLVNDRGEIQGLLTHESLRQLLRPIDMLRLRRVREIIIRNVISARAIDSVAKIASLMLEHKVSSVVVVEDQSEKLLPVGIITEGDIVQYLALGLDLTQTLVNSVMSFPVVTIDLDETLWKVREIMQERMINHLIVTEAGLMAGIISQSDLLKTLRPTEMYKLFSTLETKMSRLEQEKLELLESRNKLLENQVQASESALVHSQSKQQILIKALPDLVIRMSGDGIYLDFYPTDTFDVFDTEDVVGKSIYATNYPIALAEMRMDYIRQALRTRERQIYEQEIVVNGRSHIEEVRISICGENEVLIVVRDISDRKLSEKSLQESEQRLRTNESLLSAMFNRAYVGMTINDLDGKFVRANAFYQEMVGYSESELQSIHFFDNTFPEDIPEHLRLRNLVVSGKCEGYQLEKRILHRDGHIIWVRTTSSLILDDDGNQKLLFGLIENISDLKQAEGSLQSLVEGTAAQTGENFLPALAEYVGKALEVRYVFVTKRMGDLLELKIAWVDGQIQPTSVIPLPNTPCSLTLREGRYFCAQHLIDNFIDNEVIKNLEMDSYLGIAITSSQGETIGTLCILDDKPISNLQRADAMLRVFAARVSAELERQEAIENLCELNQQLESRVERRTRELQFANQQLVETNTELARATRLKDEFLANMSHELRTPLNAVLGMSEGLITGVFGELNAKQIRSLSLIETSGRHLLELINDILDVAKIGAGKLELEIGTVSVEHLCKSSLSFVKEIASQKNIQLQLSVQFNIQAIAIDERRMRQVLINLLSNAVKFTPKGGKICLEVKLQEIAAISSAPSCEQLIFSVIDTGIGISSENINKLFQPFVQIDSSLNRQYTGTGLGLTLVKQIAELHGGSVSVTSQIDKGSCFSISIPYVTSIKLDKSDELAQLSHSYQNLMGKYQPQSVIDDSSEYDSLINPLILLADDNPINIETFSNYLTSRGYRIVVAANGQEAIAMVAAHHPDLVIMDIQMPTVDGISAITEIRRNPEFQHMPIVAVTALAMLGDRERCLEVGADEYLTKPVNLSHLHSVIKQQLRRVCRQS